MITIDITNKPGPRESWRWILFCDLWKQIGRAVFAEHELLCTLPPGYRIAILPVKADQIEPLFGLGFWTLPESDDMPEVVPEPRVIGDDK